MSIESIIDGIIVKEGGYVDDPRDRGGKTNWGITEKVARAAGYHGEMQDLPRERAVEIYTREYVIGPGFDRVALVSPAIAEELVDTGVNMGPGVPGPWLQRILTLLNLNGKLYADLVIDGAIGGKTLTALVALRQHRGPAEADAVILKALNGLQAARYIEIAESKPQNRAFIFGWLKGRVS